MDDKAMIKLLEEEIDCLNDDLLTNVKWLFESERDKEELAEKIDRLEQENNVLKKAVRVLF